MTTKCIDISYWQGKVSISDFKKVNGVWVEQTDLANLFSTTANYKKES